MLGDKLNKGNEGRRKVGPVSTFDAIDWAKVRISVG